MGERLRFRILGASMVVVIVLLLALTVALYNKAFTPTLDVKVRSERAGLQLLPHSDVKVRGLIVGEVRDTDADAQGATLHLALDPGKAKLIPRNVQARLLPKTLFGEKYVDLEIPAQAGALGLRSGQVIQQDRSQAAVEIDKVLNDLLPLLQAVKPAELNATLNALATALQGRGDQIGRNLEEADELLRKVNPQLGTLVHDLNALADVSDIYNAAAPDLLQTLRNLNVTSRTITDKKATIEQLIPATTALAQDGDVFMRQNAPKIIGFNIANRDGLDLIARYSPSLPCVFAGLMKLKPESQRVAGGNGSKTFNLTVEIVKPVPGYKYPLDKPEAKDQRDPRCYGLPNPKVPSPTYLALDGTQDDLWWKNPDDPNAGGSRGRALSNVFVDPGSMSEKDKIKNVLGPVTRTRADQLSDVAALMFGPLLGDGSVVTVK
ncbi:phospholipid/cholesterol/gamma-HCH transport system substrate-binding protein [Actinomadura luteofluorescens]|uniref:Phospholipid/cholesterol/gamma-HCH transport system substrate-binding protein n=1 Tax=Actinomadura luteofluorescens TaxID=46163 RepID=A0A7Y9JHJ6_9ACTN|nr:MCE family protein [Actinomadura luteofluorescens]NYD49120.1 phospholipid/cholesterol/gamma-HCH transport system substrate-binding protein [Actinomadura luteofluorescens]